ncbi:alpha-L-fucosidase [Sphingomonas sp. Leaf412]|uniref:alpha-L-fucosidase n=1 Tax=Sphingomonas sp. Leaf412 TaxID=1736370 RepID=UPI0006FFF0D2|nr:alpha-L-fucosidase [Sphingomonas sp. Leaf412]KQT34629.1 alpha-L-fucosidase [Sphingomonas sp. Leaf412]
MTVAPPTPDRRRVVVAGLAATAAAAVPAVARPRIAAPAPWGAVPSPRQWRWHARERYAFVHFSINTFTDKEWGYGDEDPALFDPADFSADQIVGAAKAGGMRGLVLTAKHHDGFCLWPTTLTDHCIRNAPYKGGKGDIVGEMAAACRRAGLAFGLYLSPWDRNHADYGRPAYVEYFRRQVVELCTRYGELFEFWFDGANGGDGYYGGAREMRRIDAPRYYDWPAIVALVHRHQPMACTFDPLGSDIRWVGNEDGIAGDPCWPTMPDHPYVQAEGNSGVRGGALWWPAETNTSIRPGWFHHADEDSKVRSPDNLVRYHDTSVGRGTNMHLNLPPDRRGRIPDQDARILKSFGDAIRASFATDLAQGAVAAASHVRGPGFEPARVLDGDRETYWSAPDGVTTPSLTLDLPPGRAFDLVRIREYLPLGVRVTRFAVDAEVDGAWRTLATRECISAQRIIRLPAPITARRVRLRILDAPVCPAIGEVSLFRSVAPVPVPAIVSSDPSVLSIAGWRIVSASAPGAAALLDDDAGTVWVLPAPTPGAPATVTVDLGVEQVVAGFTLTPSRHVMDGAAPPKGYVADTSRDGRTWRAGAAGELPNIAYALSTQRFAFAAPRPMRYLRLAFAETAVPARRLAIAGIGGFAPRR